MKITGQKPIIKNAQKLIFQTPHKNLFLEKQTKPIYKQHDKSWFLSNRSETDFWKSGQKLISNNRLKTDFKLSIKVDLIKPVKTRFQIIG